MTATPLFSIVVPTRSRSATLRFTLETCARVDFDDFEVIIGDNASTDDTAEVAASFVARDPRFRHCRSTGPLSAAANFERLLDEARGQYLIYIGDDDGIYRHALRFLGALIERYRPDALNWLPEGFVWPAGGRSIWGFFPLDQFTGVYSETQEAAYARVNAVEPVHHFSLTGFDLYHGCVSRAAIDRARARFGRLFAGPIPDVAASYLLMAVIDQILTTGLSATVAGLSSASIGHAYTTPQPTAEQIAIREGFLRDNRATFPQTDPIFEAFTMLTPYIATFADFLRASEGSLARLETAHWADAMLDQIALDYPDDRDKLIAQANDFFARAALEGAPSVPAITPGMVRSRRASGEFRRRLPWTRHCFTRDEITAAIATVPYAGRGRPGGLIYRYVGAENALFIDARTVEPQFTVADFTTLHDHLLRLSSPDFVTFYLDEPEAAREMLLGALACDAAADLAVSDAAG